MMQMRRRQQKYRHVAPALALMTTVVVAMAGITVLRLARIPAENPGSVPPAAVRVRLVGVQRAEAASDVSAREAAAREAAARVTAAAALSARATGVAEQAASASVADPAPPKVVEAESPTLPLSPATLMVGLAAARSRTLASASPRPAPPAECNGPVVENFDPDIAGMTGLPGRKMYYGRAQKNVLASACRRGAQAATSTP